MIGSNMLFKGFKFGMLLQLAIGPVCVFIFQMASINGFYIGEMGVIGVTLVDGIFIIVAIQGIASIINRKNIKFFLKVFGSIVLLVFGFSTILSQYDSGFLPTLSMVSAIDSNNVFTKSIIITASNPLTIIFWVGVFSTKLVDENIKKQDIYSFGFGSLLSTAAFLTMVSLIGSLAKLFLSTEVIQILNIIVGLLLICFSVKLFFKKV